MRQLVRNLWVILVVIVWLALCFAVAVVLSGSARVVVVVSVIGGSSASLMASNEPPALGWKTRSALIAWVMASTSACALAMALRSRSFAIALLTETRSYDGRYVP